MRGQTGVQVLVISGIRGACQSGIQAAPVGDGTVSAIRLEALHVAPEELLVAAKIEGDAGGSAAQVVRDRRRRAAAPAVEPIAREIYLAPDLRRIAPPA